MLMLAVDAYINRLPEEQAALCEQIRQLIVTTIPGISEKLSFKIPFYRYHGMFCYLNAVPAGIDVGFLRGRDLTDIFPQLEQRNRKIVASVVIRHSADIRQLELPEIIATAAKWNEEAARQKKSFLTVPNTRKSGTISSGRKSARGRR